MFGTSEHCLEIRLSCDQHPSEEMFEEYCFDRLGEDLTAMVEEHFLACTACQRTLQDLEDYIRLIKGATAKLTPSVSGSPAGRVWAQVRSTPLAMLAASLLTAGALASFWAFSRTTDRRRTEPAAVTTAVALVAFRGGEDGGVTRAPAGRPLELAIDVTDLPASNAYRLELVSAAGQQVWDAAAFVSKGKLSVRVARGLKAGVYWVELYSPPAGLLREFGLRLE